MPVRIDHAASSPAHDIIYLRDLLISAGGLRVHILRKVHIRIDEEAVSLDGDMADRILPLLIVIRIRGNIERNSLLVKRHSRKRHVALPADQITHRSPRCLHYREEILIRISPDHALTACRFQLSVVHRLSIRRDHDIGIVNRRRNSITLRISDTHIHRMLFHTIHDSLHLRSIH